MEDKTSQEETNCITIESNRIDETNDNQLNKVIVFSLKLILIGLSAVYLSYECIQLIKLYHNYDTIVSVYYQRPDSDQIPAITLCLPAIIDRNRLLAKHPELALKLNNGSLSEDHRKNILTDYLDKALESGHWPELTVREDQALNCTLNYWPIKSDAIIGHSMPTTDSGFGLNCRDVVKPIESYSNAKTKCFTYFSQLSSERRFVDEYSLRAGPINLNDLYEIIRIELSLDFERYLHLSFIRNETTIAIHHRNAGSEATAQHIEAGNQYEITINKIITRLMGRPYKSQCSDYQRKDIGSRKQCIDSCVLDLYKDKCDCIPIHLSDTLQLLNWSSHVICTQREMAFRSNPCYQRVAQEVGLCLTSERCPQDCQTIQYRYRTKSQRLITSCAEMSSSNETDICSTKVSIRIRFDESTGDKVVQHIPLITSGQLLAHISALIAIFSGLSIIAFANSLIAKLSNVRLFARPQVRDDGSGGDDRVGCDQQIKQRTKQWLEKSRCIDRSDRTVDSTLSTRVVSEMRPAMRRPLTSTVFDTHMKSVANTEVRAQDI